MAERQSPPPDYHGALHSVQRLPTKPGRKRGFPPPPRVYRVEPRGFRQLVQRLTGSTQSTCRARKEAVIPPPIELAPRVPLPPPIAQPGNPEDVRLSEFLSPSLYSTWCSFPLLSPGTMSALELDR
ncbi:uncharacterized protein [Typha latifolia]|uniref:uncharacterized protein n=1 Tax=Typha latifolia TaxID=4733 RepID=UPI003C2B4315